MRCIWLETKHYSGSPQWIIIAQDGHRATLRLRLARASVLLADDDDGDDDSVFAKPWTKQMNLYRESALSMLMCDLHAA